MTHQISENNSNYDSFPVRVLQVGDGNFIRSFIDWMIDQLNYYTNFNGRVVTIQALPEDVTTPILNKQNGAFSLLLKGRFNGELVNKIQLIQSIKSGVNPYNNWQEVLSLSEEETVEFIFSNTTEAGIKYKHENLPSNNCASSYPGKLTQLLYHRYSHFNGDFSKGWIILPCELIENNGDELKKICLKIASDWGFAQEFVNWVQEACTFCNTLVDRIVPGFPHDKSSEIFKDIGYKDPLLTVAEPYHLFVIESNKNISEKLPFHQAHLNVVFDEVYMYRELKVNLLNGSHTIMAILGLLSGLSTVKDTMQNDNIYNFVNQALLREIAPSMQGHSINEIINYIKQMYERFNNPYLEHNLSDIHLNSYEKFKTRVWPSIFKHKKLYDKYPKHLIFVFSALLYFYKEAILTKKFSWNDEPGRVEKLEKFFSSFNGSTTELNHFILSLLHEDFPDNESIFNELGDLIVNDFFFIEEFGIKQAIINRK